MSEKQYIERYWRDATPADAIKEPPMVARFRSRIDQEWIMDTLQGIDRSEPSKWCGKDVTCRYCQVYDAPDPGEGWRLIDPEKDKPQEDDQYLCPISNVWCFCNEYLRRVNYSKDSIVRRRIEQPKPKYVPFTWEDREQLRGRWITRDNQELQLVNLDNSDGFFANGVHVVNLCLYWKFIDTGEPVGKEIAQ